MCQDLWSRRRQNILPCQVLRNSVLNLNIKSGHKSMGTLLMKIEAPLKKLATRASETTGSKFNLRFQHYYSAVHYIYSRTKEAFVLKQRWRPTPTSKVGSLCLENSRRCFQPEDISISFDVVSLHVHQCPAQRPTLDFTPDDIVELFRTCLTGS